MGQNIMFEMLRRLITLHNYMQQEFILDSQQAISIKSSNIAEQPECCKQSGLKFQPMRIVSVVLIWTTWEICLVYKILSKSPMYPKSKQQRQYTCTVKNATLYLRDITITKSWQLFGSKGDYALHQQLYFEANRYLVPILM